MSDFEDIDRCAKRPVDIWTQHLYYFFSLRFVYAIRKTRITPNQVTLLSFLVFLVAAALFFRGTRSDIIAGVCLQQASFVLDCADGQLARYKKIFSPFGAWLDQTADRVKEFLLILTLAAGSARLHPGLGVWPLALCALFLLFMLEYYEQQRGRVAISPTRHASTAHRVRKLRAARQFVPFRGFTIGEQYFLTGVLLLIGGAFVTLLGLVIVAGAMVIYLPIARALKSRAGDN
ncbi:MAG: CDP-alcohol phosphatidyltransferase family protein [Firmicutes bacterium]|nr:CDP-alcohol phosphatidyltransferase family protein [Bacillota bacterium]